MAGWILGIVIGVAVAVLCGAVPLRNWLWRREFDRARQSFRREREVLEAKFFDLASASGKPRGLRWVDCDWLDAVSFARDRQTGLLAAFVAVNIRFEAIEGEEMEGVAAVGNVRDAAAVFHYQAGHWGTGGRALFNMNPADALARLNGQFEPLPLPSSAG
ncbi:MAG: hypothetical protein ACKV0T_03975 [Planctomycetales bacterium]